MRALLEKFLKLNQHINVVYEIIGQVDGIWTIRAFDRNGKQIGIEVCVNSPKEVWRVWSLLNGYGSEDGFDEDTVVIPQGRAS